VAVDDRRIVDLFLHCGQQLDRQRLEQLDHWHQRRTPDAIHPLNIEEQCFDTSSPYKRD
jgi:hypothetical protein